LASGVLVFLNCLAQTELDGSADGQALHRPYGRSHKPDRREVCAPSRWWLTGRYVESLQTNCLRSERLEELRLVSVRVTTWNARATRPARIDNCPKLGVILEEWIGLIDNQCRSLLLNHAIEDGGTCLDNGDASRHHEANQSEQRRLAALGLGLLTPNHVNTGAARGAAFVPSLRMRTASGSRDGARWYETLPRRARRAVQRWVSAGSKQCRARNAPRPSEALVEAAGALAQDPVEIPALLFLDDRFLLLACFHERSAAIDIGARARWSLMPARGVVLAGHRRLLARTGGHAGTKLSGWSPCRDD